MCGICGLIGPTGQPVPEPVLREMTSALAHRGPDGEGLFLDGPVGLGHRRLAIIDLKTGDQPLSTADGRFTLTYNGEVYNYPELRRELEGLGHEFRTSSDTEVVLEAYAEWGRECLTRFRGMFALGIYDRAEQTLFLARDRLGIKPLVYGRVKDRFAFGSELYALKPAFPGQLRLDPEGLDEFFQWGYIPAPRTIWREIRKLPPAHFLELDLATGRERLEPYWELRFAPDEDRSYRDFSEELDELIKEAVRLRLVSDVPFGVLLSGGVDSSLVVRSMAEAMTAPPLAFSIGFNEAEWSELEYARRAAEISGAVHRTETVEPEGLAILPTLVSRYGEPFGDSSAIPSFYVARMARREVKMVLTGDGGDELFAGYRTHESIMGRVLGQQGRGLAKDAGLSPLLRVVKRLAIRLSGLGKNPESPTNLARLRAKWIGHFPQKLRAQIYSRAMARHLTDRIGEGLESFSRGSLDPISRVQREDLRTYLPGDILTKMDIASMANSLEARVPILDHKVVELAGRMPSRFKFEPVRTDRGVVFEKKKILREVTKRYFPAEHVDRPKMGFGIPLGEWFKGRSGFETAQRLTKSERLAGIVRPEQVAKILAAQLQGADVSHLLWSLLFLDEWLDQNQDMKLSLN